MPHDRKELIKRVKGRGPTVSYQPGMLSERRPCAPERGDLEIDNGASERADRAVAVGRGNWTFFGSDQGGRTAAVPLSFVATCKRCGVEPFAWFREVLSRIAMHPMHRIAEPLPHNWKALAASQA